MSGETPETWARCPHCDLVMHYYQVPQVTCTKCINRSRCQIQSEEVALAPTVDQMETSEKETTGFIDSAVGAKVGHVVSPLDYELADAQVAAGLTGFLSRPVRISSFAWAQADSTGVKTTINPWALFAQNSSIQKKLENYAFIRGDLKVKVITNGSPFLFGAMRACYTPIHLFSPDTAGGTTAQGLLIPMSQKPGVWVSPSHNEGAELTLPFFWPRSFLRVGLLSDFTAMGKLDYAIYAALQSANGATSSVTVQTYAWMENVVLAGPTLAPSLQADEYGVGAISGPASAVAAVAHKFQDIPVIGKFAKATSIGASAVSTIAKLFGFTNVPVIEDARPYRPSPFPQLATAEIGYPTEKLALDPKNELSIDPSIVGMAPDDELVVAKMAQRESYLATTFWANSTAVDTPLFTTKVTPQLGVNSSTYRQFIPAGLLSTLFRNWRGDLIFRFKFVTTPFHKGRVRISYDPYSASVQTTGDTGPFVYNKIVDLGSETDVEFRVPYQQALPWSYTAPLPVSSAWSTSTTPALSYVDTYDNGVLSLKVLTSLTGPATTQTISVLVFVRGAENLEFSNPTTGPFNVSAIALQSEEYSEQATGSTHTMGEPSDDSTNRALVNFGEAIRSLRPLLRRQNYLDTVVIPAGTANTTGVFSISQTRFPCYYGYDPSGWDTAKGTITPANTYAFNYANMTPWHLVANCFAAQRGSMIWTFNPSKNDLGIVSRITRWNGSTIANTKVFDVKATSTANQKTYANWVTATPTNAGGSLTHTSTSNGHSVLVPSYSPFKFQNTNPLCASRPAQTNENGYDGMVYDTFAVEFPVDEATTPLTGVTVERYFGIGTDYTLHFFVNCPTLQYLDQAFIVPN